MNWALLARYRFIPMISHVGSSFKDAYSTIECSRIVKRSFDKLEINLHRTENWSLQSVPSEVIASQKAIYVSESTARASNLEMCYPSLSSLDYLLLFVRSFCESNSSLEQSFVLQC